MYHKITARVLSALFPYFQKSGSRLCDYTLGCMYLWADYFSYRYRIENGFLIVRGVMEGVPFYLCPTGEGDRAAAVASLKRETLAIGQPLIFAAVPSDSVAEISACAPYSATLCERDWSDYLYLADDLISFAGKKYHGQKNQLNGFQKNYAPAFSAIDAATASDAALFLQQLEMKENEREEEHGYEKKRIAALLRDWDLTGQIGGILTVEGSIVAFSVGEVIGDTLFVHVEKADRGYRGAYTAVCNAFVKFAKEKYPEIVYVNREDDMGMEGLRKAKTDLHPVRLVEKPNVILSEQTEVPTEWSKLAELCEI